MNGHLHHARIVTGWVLGILVFLPFTWIYESSAESSKSPNELAVVTGQATYSGRPLHGMVLCLDSTVGVHSACAELSSDGSFRLGSMYAGNGFAFPGRYHAHFLRRSDSPSLPAKYCDAGTAGLEIEIPAHSSDLDIDLK